MSLTGKHLNALRYKDSTRCNADVSIGLDWVYIDGVQYTPEILRFLADMVDSMGEHLMSECYWTDCPEHGCPFYHLHTRSWCGRPTCREG